MNSSELLFGQHLRWRRSDGAITNQPKMTLVNIFARFEIPNSILPWPLPTAGCCCLHSFCLACMMPIMAHIKPNHLDMILSNATKNDAVIETFNYTNEVGFFSFSLRFLRFSWFSLMVCVALQFVVFVELYYVANCCEWCSTPLVGTQTTQRALEIYR